jgi:[NiFe] hydrogenase diaphorase moiety large subunit
MSAELDHTVRGICQQHQNDRRQMMHIVRAVQERFGCVSQAAMDVIATACRVHRIEVWSCVSFYQFLSDRPKGKVVIRLCNDVIDKLRGVDRVARAFEEELGIRMGQTTGDGKITLEWTPCIGMCDQAPAALINDVPVTFLSTDGAREIARDLREHLDPDQLVFRLGDGNNEHPLVHAMVNNNLRVKGEFVFGPMKRAESLQKALSITPAEVIRAIKTSRLRGRGGAGFPTGLKWEFCRAAPGDQKVIIGNADEGEPGTFKDRVILTEVPDRVFAGMTIAGYAIGAEEGILYLRGEYAYLRAFLEDVLQKRRDEGLLGKNILGKHGFNFDIRIVMGAGAYICGEETALISSCEGTRGDPKTRPPFPAQKGYLGRPTVVNNIETLCKVVKIMELGPASFCEIGSAASPGTKVLSVSGDCRSPGVYELPFGTTIKALLKLCGAENAIAVQVGGPSGQMVDPGQYDRTICYDDLATGGSIMVFGPGRNVLEIAEGFMDFFCHESCGYCTPCRVGNVLLKERLSAINAGRGDPSDLAYLQELGETVKLMSRCGLGQTSAHPVLTTLKNFRPVYERMVKPRKDGLLTSFDLRSHVQEAERIVGRMSAHA